MDGVVFNSILVEMSSDSLRGLIQREFCSTQSFSRKNVEGNVGGGGGEGGGDVGRGNEIDLYIYLSTGAGLSP